MKIIHIYDEHGRVFPGVGSVPYIVYNIAKYTTAKGHDVTVLERRWDGLDYKEELEGIKFERFDLHFCSSISRKEPTRKLIKSPIGLLRFILSRTEFALKTLRYLKKNNFDIVTVYFPFAAVILVTLSRKLRKKMIYGEMIGEIKKRLKLGSMKDTPLLFRFIPPDLYLMRRVRKVVMQNKEVRAELVSAGKIEPEKVTAISLGVDTSEFYPDISIDNVKKRYGLSDKTTAIVLFASEIVPRKGVEYLVRAADIIVNQLNYKDTLFLLKGKAYEKEYLESIRKLIEEYKLEENVKMILGYIPLEDVKRLYVASNIYVLPSLEEPCPTSLLEPLACGKPLVGTNIGGIVTMIRDGWNGFLVEPANEKQLADKIKYLIDHPEEWEERGRNSRKLAEEEFDWRKIAEKYLGVYEEVKGQENRK
jgi:glycosyltransferase involved in cell wall biosynthesis